MSNSRTPEDLLLAAKPTLNGQEPWQEAEIQSILANITGTIQFYQDQLRLKVLDVEEAKLQVKVQRGLKMLESVALKNQKQLTSEGDRKAWVDTRDEVINAEEALIRVMGEELEARLRYDSAENLFTAVRKAATLIEKNHSNQQRESRYGSA